MGDYAIRMQFDVEAGEEAVRRALTTLEGVASWWSTKVTGSPDADGGRLEVMFPDQPEPFELSVSLGPSTVDWVVGAVPEWWRGTTVHWEWEPSPEGTRLRFQHRGFDPENPVIDIVTPAWAHIVSRLKGYAETGRSQPFFDF